MSHSNTTKQSTDKGTHLCRRMHTDQDNGTRIRQRIVQHTTKMEDKCSHSTKDNGQIQEEKKSVNLHCTTGDLQEHAKGCCLIGIWKNTTVQQLIKILTQEEGYPEELAMERVKDLSMQKLQHSAAVYKKIKENEGILKTDITQMEKDIGSYLRGEQSRWPYRKRQHFGKQYQTDYSGCQYSGNQK